MLSRLSARLRDERGISLFMSLLLMSALAVTTTGMIVYTSSGSRTASLERSSVSARALAEAGLANALSVLGNAPNKTDQALLPLPAAQPRTFTFEGGTAEVRGLYQVVNNGDDGLWTVTSTGIVANPTGGAPVRRTLTQRIEVHGGNDGGNAGDWNRMIHEDPDPNNCLSIADVEIPTPVRSGGCINLYGTAKITGEDTTVDAGSTVTMVGESDSPTGDPPDTNSGWDTSSEVRYSDGDDASRSIAGGGTSPALDMRDFDFELPTGAQITGIRVRIERSASNSGSIYDYEVRVLRASSPAAGSDNKAVPYPTTWGTGDSTQTYGGSTDTWHPTTAWTAAEINSSGFGVRLVVRNASGSSRTARVDYVEVRVYYSLPPQSSIGLDGQNVREANVVTSCKYGSQAANSPCSATDHVYADTHTQGLPAVVKPEVDLDYWYRNAKPGPAHPCNNPGGSFAGGFDNNYSAANPHPDNSRNWTYEGAEVTPETMNYDCRVIENGVTVGQITWNRTTRVLTIRGTIYIDGDFRFDDDGTVVHYQGRGIIFASGKLEFDEVVCAGGSGLTSCLGPIVDGRATNLSNWDPSQNMMTLLSGGMGSGIGSEFDQGATADPAPAYDRPGALQGLIYSEDDCVVHQWFHLSGPIICREIDLPMDSGWYPPEYYTWPDLTSLTEGQTWRSVSDADWQVLDPKEITG